MSELADTAAELAATKYTHLPTIKQDSSAKYEVVQIAHRIATKVS